LAKYRTSAFAGALGFVCMAVGAAWTTPVKPTGWDGLEGGVSFTNISIPEAFEFLGLIMVFAGIILFIRAAASE
jgi:hypothetical protein